MPGASDPQGVDTLEPQLRRTILILSGGLDSTVLLHHLRAAGDDVQALSFNYGQRHSRELEHASRICATTRTPHRLVDLQGLAPLFAGSGLVDQSVAIPHGEYDEDNMHVTVVPNRNMIMLSVAVAWAITQRAVAVAFAAHHGYHTLYPDCRPEFVEALARAVHMADWHQVDLIAPFANWTKADIVRRGAELGVAFERTWSCYEGGEAHCGRCGTCVERREAFSGAGVLDPTTYATSA
jgi:7-cyano-7-deazaguanine synthase